MIGVVTTRHLLTHSAVIVHEFGARCLFRCFWRTLTADHAVTFLECAVPIHGNGACLRATMPQCSAQRLPRLWQASAGAAEGALRWPSQTRTHRLPIHYGARAPSVQSVERRVTHRLPPTSDAGDVAATAPTRRTPA